MHALCCSRMLKQATRLHNRTSQRQGLLHLVQEKARAVHLEGSVQEAARGQQASVLGREAGQDEGVHIGTVLPVLGCACLYRQQVVSSQAACTYSCFLPMREAASEVLT